MAWSVSARVPPTVRACCRSPHGDSHGVLSRLKAPQSLLAAGEGRYWLAEGGRDRVLERRLP